MKRRGVLWKEVIVAVSALFFSCFGNAQDTIFDFSQRESKITFEVKHLGFLTVGGAFKMFSGTIVFRKDRPVEMNSRIVANSITTNDSSRDATLKSKEYLNVAAYPEIVFYATHLSRVDKEVEISGILQIRHVQQKVDLNFSIAQGMLENRMLLKAETTLKRSDFALDFGVMDELVGDNITVKLELLGIKRLD